VTQQITSLARVDNVVVFQQNQVMWTGPTKEFLADPSLCAITRGGEPLSEQSIDRDVSEYVDKEYQLLDDQQQHDGEASLVGSGPFEGEERAEGAVRFRVFQFYAKCAAGILEAFAVLFVAVLSILSKIIASYWFVWWIGDTLRLEKAQYIAGYLGVTLSQTVISGNAGTVYNQELLANTSHHSWVRTDSCVWQHKDEP
jgi:hypothetical protein